MGRKYDEVERRPIGTEGLALWRASENDLGSPPLEPPAARQTDPDTSHLAAESMIDGVASDRRLILDALAVAGRRGLIYTEIAEWNSWEGVKANRRLAELRHAGLVCRLMETRKTDAGRPARVYVLPEYIGGRSWDEPALPDSDR